MNIFKKWVYFVRLKSTYNCQISMIEKSIYLEGVDPVNLYGVNNILLNKLASKFPKLRVVARGHEVIAIGEEKEILLFEEKLDILIAFYHRYNKLTIQDVEDLLESSDESWLDKKLESGTVRVFSWLHEIDMMIQNARQINKTL